MGGLWAGPGVVLAELTAVYEGRGAADPGLPRVLSGGRLV